MIDMEVSLDELSADAATTAVYLIDDLGIYVLDELTQLAGSAPTIGFSP
jgi:hypothetical protein